MLARFLCCLMGAVALAACGVVPTAPQPIEFQAIAPKERATSYSRPLTCLGELLRTYSSREEPILIGVMTASDVTGANQYTSAEVPREFTLMVEAAVNSISPRIRLTNVDHDFQVREASIGGRFARQTPALLLKPGISEFDRGLSLQQTKRDASGFFGKGKGATDLSGDKGSESVTSRIGVDMMAYDYISMVSIPNVHSSVAAEVGRRSEEASWSLAVYGWGVGTSVVSKAIQGRHEAVRTLTEYGVLQTLGRYFKLPYWRCVEGMPEDSTMKDQLSRAHSRMKLEERIASVQELLKYHGFNAVQATGKVDAATQQAIGKLSLGQAQLSPAASADLYVRLYVAIPVANVPQPKDWYLVKPFGAPHTAAPAPAARAVQAEASMQLSLDKANLARGEEAPFRLTVKSDLYAYCYLQDSEGAVMQFYPNRNAPTAMLKAGASLSARQMGVVLTAHEQGKPETIGCLGAATNITAQLPLGGRDMEPLPVASIEDAIKLLQQAAGPSLAVARLRIQGQ